MCKTTTVRGIHQTKTHATARFVVVRRIRGGDNRVGGATVELRDIRSGRVVKSGQTVGGVIETENTGTWTTPLLRAGTYDATVIVSGSGPFGNAAVQESPWKQRLTLKPLADFAEGETPNEILVVMAWRNPIVRVTVLDVTMTPTAIVGADVEIIGVSRGTTDRFGQFGSEPAPFGMRGVRVTVPGMFPTTQRGSTFFRQVELRETGIVGSMPNGRDLELVVEMSQMAPVNLPGTHPRPIAVFASGGATPLSVADDPRLPNPGGGDTAAGQDGWDHGMRYGGNWNALTSKLNGGEVLPARLGGGTIGPHQVRRLAIVAHGAPGTSDVDQQLHSRVFGHQPPNENVSLTVARIPLYSKQTDDIRKCMHEDGIVYFFSCTTAEDPAGELLLRRLSALWPTIRVVGCRTILSTGTMNWQRKPGTVQQYPGLRDTRHRHAGFATRDCDNPTLWNDLNALPWFDEDSPHATVALDGNIIRRGDPPG